MTNLLLVGAGPIARTAADAALGDGVVAAVAAVVDPDPEALGAARTAYDCPGWSSVADAPEARPGDSALVAFSSRAEPTAGDIIRLVSLGYDVVTTCEELAWPDRHIHEALVTSARSDGRRIIATGANPGFAMDLFPLMAAAASRNVRRIEVIRRVDTAHRRPQLVAKTGRGLTPDAFAAGVEAGELGHVGLEQSARLIAKTMEWSARDVRAAIEPLVVDGTVTGLRQHVRLATGEGPTIDLELVMGWDLPGPTDTVRVEGSPPVEMTITGGYHGDEGTTTQVVMALERCHELPPGFYRSTELPLRYG